MVKKGEVGGAAFVNSDANRAPLMLTGHSGLEPGGVKERPLSLLQNEVMGMKT